MRGVFLEGVEDDSVVLLFAAFAVEQDGLDARLENRVAELRREDRLTADDLFVTLDGYHLTGILVYEVFGPCLEHVSGQNAPHALGEGGLGHFDFFGQVEAVEDVLVGLEADGTKQGGYR